MKVMSRVLVMTAVVLMSCSRKEVSPTPASDPATPVATTTQSATSTTSTEAAAATDTAFDISRVPVTTPSLGAFPYVSLIDGYAPVEKGTYSKDAKFDRHQFFDGTKLLPIEGRRATIEAHGGDAGAIEVLRTYESLVREMGGISVFQGKGKAVSNAGQKYEDKLHNEISFGTMDDQIGVYVVRTPEREIWIEALVPSRWEGYRGASYQGKANNYFVTVVEKSPLEVRARLLDAEEMKSQLDAVGHVTLYVGFDFDRADIRPDSQPAIDRVAELMRKNADLKLKVEGHTDNVGSADYNRRLSADRARSVVTAVAAKGIDAGRMQAAGVGPDRPLADNGTEDGRSKNRRVELVKLP